MLCKRLKSVVLLSLSLFSICHAVEKEDSKNLDLSTIKYSVLAYAGLFMIPVIIEFGTDLYLRPKLDEILEYDLNNNLECNIIHYLDKDKISLIKDEIRRYSAAYYDLLSRLDKDDEVKKEKVYDKLKVCALFLIRTDARLKRTNKKLTNDTIEEDVKRYKGGTGACILSESCFKKNFGNIWERNDYLNYIYVNYKLTVNVGPDGLYGWVIDFSPKKLTFGYENCKPI